LLISSDEQALRNIMDISKEALTTEVI
jgi:hypothetical protein